MSFSIRMGNGEDASAIAEFQLAMAWETEDKKLDLNVVQSAVRKVFQDATKGFYIVAESNAQVVAGLLITKEWSDWRDTDIWYIQSVYVVNEFRGQGIYKAMYRRIVELAKENDVKHIRLYVETDNEKAQKVYEAMGMKKLPYLMYDAKVADFKVV
ncbi:MAG: GNAT family N-acetyltransferase [Planctomycetota bacterium]